MSVGGLGGFGFRRGTVGIGSLFGGLIFGIGSCVFGAMRGIGSCVGLGARRGFLLRGTRGVDCSGLAGGEVCGVVCAEAIRNAEPKNTTAQLSFDNTIDLILTVLGCFILIHQLWRHQLRVPVRVPSSAFGR